jgi:hypothetical protein
MSRPTSSLALPLTGLELLNGAAMLSPAGGKIVSYRSARAVESVLFKTLQGRTVGRIYDKGLESGTALRGHLIRPEAQMRLQKATRRHVEEADADFLRGLFQHASAPSGRRSPGSNTLAPSGLPNDSAKRSSEVSSHRPARGRWQVTWSSRSSMQTSERHAPDTSWNATAGSSA